MTTPKSKTPTHAPMSLWPTRDGEVIVGGLPLSRLAARVGQTPFYAYDRGLVSQRVAQLRTALPAAIKLHYAMKANPMPALVAHLAGQVDGIDVASTGEMQVALDAGVSPSEISMAAMTLRTCTKKTACSD